VEERARRAFDAAYEARRAAAKAAPRSVPTPAAAWMRHSNFEELTILARCVEEYRGAKRGPAAAPPASLVALQAWASHAGMSVDPGCASLIAAGDAQTPFAGASSHDRVHYTRAPGPYDPWRAGGYSLEVEAVWSSKDEPVIPNYPGTRSFLVDVAGVVHSTSEHRRASRADPVLRPCGEFPADIGDCAPYAPRDRWSVAESPSG
jgi:hypothetical protein